MPLFDYCIAAFCDLRASFVARLQKAQNAGIRYIFNLRLEDHVAPFYKLLGWLKIKEKIENNVLIVFRKITATKQPQYLYEKFVTLHNVHQRTTRFGNEVLHFPIYRTELYSKSFHVKSIKHYNELDRSIKDVQNEKLFKKKVRDELLKRYEYIETMMYIWLINMISVSK